MGIQVKRYSNGKVITLEDKIASGGEGEICPVLGDTSLVAKVYFPKILTDTHGDKLKVMLDNPPDDSARAHGYVSIAWPVDLLLSTSGSQQIIGFLMPRVKKVPHIHDYYSPGTRRQKTPYFNYQYLHQTARNFAAAMSALHAEGYVIGDVNESNILVAETAMVTLVDTDSFQVRDPRQNKVYRCPVGKPEYTPPELQGKKFGDHDRSPEHDLFGLGVLIFQLLMEGTHPFMGAYQGSGDEPRQEKRIVAGHFPYGNKTVPYRRPPNAPPFDVLHSGLRDLFVRCFEDGHNNPKARPDARSWVKALEAAEKDLVSCGVNPQHQYGGHLSRCPWCERKKQLQGRDPFPPMPGIQFNIPVQIPLPPASKPKPVSSPAPTPTYATPVRPTPTPIYNPSPSPTLTATPAPTHKTPPLATRKFLDKALTLGGISAVLSVSFFLFYPHQDPELKTKQKHITDYIKSLQLNPSGADTYNKRGLVRHGLGDKKGAIEDYKIAIQINPRFAEAYNNMGDAHYDLGDKKVAITDYKTAIQIDPKFAEAYKNLGDAHYHYLGNKNEAIEDYNQAIKFNPQYAEAYLGLGIVRYDVGDKKGAIEDFNQAIQLNSQLSKLANLATAYNNRGLARSELGDKQAAIQDFNQAIQLDPKAAIAYSNRGLARSELGDKQAAIQDFNQAIQLDPKLAKAYHPRGIARYHLGDKKGAIEDFDQAIKFDPKLAKAYNDRGFLRSNLGDKKGAIEDYNQAAQIDQKEGKTEEYQKSIDEIRKLQQ